MSAYHCCVPRCTNDSRYDKDKALSFHKFPTDDKLQKQWITKIRRDIGPNFRISNSTRVCSSHFESSDIRRTLNGKRMLKLGSVPSLFPWSPTPSKLQKTARRDKTSNPNKIGNGNTEGVPQKPKPKSHTVPLVSHDHDYHVKPKSMADKLEAARQEINSLRQQLATIKNQLFFLERFSNDPQTISFYTGFKDYDTLKCVFTDFQPTAESMVRWNQMQRQLSPNTANIDMDAFGGESLSHIDQFFMFLCWVYRGLPDLDLAIKFNISQESVTHILTIWANYLYVMLGSLKIWPSRTQIDESMPQDFKNIYPMTRVIIDCIELKVETQSSRVLNSNMYSDDKSVTTFKGLVGITPCGFISFVSSLYSGPISDTAITSECGLLDLLETGDEVMADEGFQIEDMLSAKGASVVNAPFLEIKGELSEDEVEVTPDVARIKIHVKRAIRRIKEFRFFDGVVPLNLACSVNQVWTVCAILANFRGPLS